jgi:hypothetical protein
MSAVKESRSISFPPIWRLCQRRKSVLLMELSDYVGIEK